MNLTISLQNIKKEAKRQAEIRNWDAPNLEYVVDQIIEDTYRTAMEEAIEKIKERGLHLGYKNDIIEALTPPQGE